jgi:imidazolonepropionase-like amidohydrolase
VPYAGDSLSLQRGWEATLKVVNVLNRAGVGILVGTDFGNPFIFPGTSVHAEMEALVEAGLTPLEALQAATINPARYLGVTDSLGTVAEGKLADLVLLDGNPLDEITNTQRVHAVMLNGQLLLRSDLDALMTEIVSTYGKNE